MKKSKAQQKVILFPGLVERMFAQAKALTENGQYEEANERFEEALQIGDGDEFSLSVYAYSLYEVKNFTRAKEICEDILASGPSMYFEVMELYLTICMQLREFKQVEKIIQSLLEEELIPADEIEKFKRLKKLNADIAQNQQMQFQQANHAQEDADEFEAQQFLALPVQQQLLQIHDMTECNIRPFVEELKIVLETPTLHPFIQSLLLILLVEQQVDIIVQVEKFEQLCTVNPAQLQLPTKLPQFQVVMAQLNEMLEQIPSMLEVASHLIAKHAIVLYPFEWLDYDSKSVANAYVEFVKLMFGEISEIDNELVNFVQNLEYISDLQQ